MENSEAPKSQSGSILGSDESYEELNKLIVDALKLDQDDLRRLKEMDELPTVENEKINWKFFSIMAMRGLLYGYENGELSFDKMMKIAWACTLPLKTENLQLQAMGAISAIAVKIKPSDRIARKPPFSIWIKNAAGEYGLLLERTFPDLKRSHNVNGETSDTIPSLTLKQLALFDLNLGEGGLLSEKTIYEWICEYKRKNNIPLQNTGPKNSTI